MNIKVFSIVFLFLFALRLNAEINVSLQSDKDSVLIGDNIRLKLKAVFPKGTSPIISPINLNDSLLVKKSEAIDSIISNNLSSIEYSCVVTSLRGGKYSIPPQAVPMQREGMQTMNVVMSNSLALHFIEPPVDTAAAAKPIYDIIEIPPSAESKSDYYWIFLGILASAAIIAFFILIRRKKVSNEHDDSLFSKFILLEKSKIGSEQELLDAYLKLSEIFNEYTENITSQKIDSSEAIAIIEKMFPADVLKDFFTVKRRIELVLFARKTPLAKEFKEDIKTMKHFIKRQK